MTDDTDKIIAALGLQPHPEGGYYAETWRDHAPGGKRGSGTAIYYCCAPEDFRLAPGRTRPEIGTGMPGRR